MIYFYKAFSKIASLACLLVALQPARAAQDVVTNTNSSGAGSLADAITNANARPGLDTIVFALPGPSFTINLASALPAIAGDLFIDGYSQAGAVPGPIGTRTIVVNINGAGLPGSTDVFTVNASNVTIAGLAIYGTPNYAIRIGQSVSNVHVWGNYIGTDNTGTASGLGNNGGIISNFGSFQPFINTNIIIGINGDGTDDENEGNLVVSSTGGGANGFGIVFWLTTSSIIAGNVVGLDKDSLNTSKGNAQDGILVTVESIDNFIGTNGDNVSDSLEGNMVAASGANGINVAGLSNDNVIAGNQIGLAADGAAAGNALYGLQLLNSSGNRVGTDGNGVSDAFERNVITSNGTAGIGILSQDFFTDGDASANIIAGNFIGTDSTISLVRGNTGPGIALAAGFAGFNVSDNIIGSNNDGANDGIEGNTIANNGSGIVVSNPVGGATSTGNKFSRNLIYDNAALGIDLGDDGVVPNDDGDADTGPNDLFNAPVIVNTSIIGSNLVVSGFARPNSVIEFYVADAGPNPNPLPGGFTKSFGEGQVFLFRGQEEGTLDGIADDSLGITSTYTGVEEGTGAGGTRTENVFGFTVPLASLPPGINAGVRLTALAYENAAGAGSTSEFAGAVPTVSLPVHFTSFRGRIHNGQAELVWTTTDEVDNSHFEIERSTNGDNYANIGSVPGRGGNNNVYQFFDNGPLASVNYYRLRQVDIDGKATYSRPLILRSDIGVVSAKVTPNPFMGTINLSYKLEQETQIRIRLVDPAGRIVRTISTRGGAGVNTININGLERLPSGIYMLELSGENVQFRQQLMKQ